MLSLIGPFLKGKVNPKRNPNQGRGVATRPSNYGSSASVVSMLKSQQAVEKAAYYHALLQPYNAAIERLPVCMPNVIPIPTTTTFHILRKTITCTGYNVDLKFNCPYIFGNVTGFAQIVPIVWKSDTGGNSSSVANWYQFMEAPVLPTSTKVRVIGAEMRVTYVSKLVDQSGYIHSAATFGSEAGSTDTSGQSISIYQAPLPDLDFANQMTWYEKQPVEQDSVTRCVWLPADFNDRNFAATKTFNAGVNVFTDKMYHDLQWYVRIQGAPSGLQFTVEVALILENQLNATNDVYAKSSSSLTVSQLNDVNVINEGMLRRNENSLSSLISKLANSGFDYIKEHAESLLSSGFKYLAGALL